MLLNTTFCTKLNKINLCKITQIQTHNKCSKD